MGQSWCVKGMNAFLSAYKAKWKVRSLNPVIFAIVSPKDFRDGMENV